MPGKDENEKLPAGWLAKEDKNSGKTYYVNTVSKTTTWQKPTKPAGENQADLPTDLPEGWFAKFDNKTKRVYYINSVTKKTQWTKPANRKQSRDMMDSAWNQKEGADADGPLPDGWLAKKDPNKDGKTYYVNKELQKTQWNRPTETTAQIKAKAEGGEDAEEDAAEEAGKDAEEGGGDEEAAAEPDEGVEMAEKKTGETVTVIPSEPNSPQGPMVPLKGDVKPKVGDIKPKLAVSEFSFVVENPGLAPTPERIPLEDPEEGDDEKEANTGRGRSSSNESTKVEFKMTPEEFAEAERKAEAETQEKFRKLTENLPQGGPSCASVCACVVL